MHEVVTGGSWYAVSDPDHVRRRIQLCNSQPTYMLTIARRVAVAPIFERPPQQSDYVRLWEGEGPVRSAPKGHVYGVRVPDASTTVGNTPSWKQYVPEPMKRIVRSARRQLLGPDESAPEGFNSIGYRWISEDDVLHGRVTKQLPAEVHHNGKNVGVEFEMKSAAMGESRPLK
jgi:hypothetical protein